MFDNTELADPAMAIDLVHDGRHRLSDRPLAREASAYIVVLPEHQLAFFTYTYVSGQGVAGAKIAIFGPGVEGGTLYEKMEDRAVAESDNFDAWHIGAFSMEQDLAFDRARIRWDTETISLDYTFEATHPPYSYAGDPKGCPSFCADDRIEQSGRVRGHLRFQDKTIELDCTGHRDHSWGTRDWMAMQHYEWFLAQVGEDVSIHFWQLQALGRVELRGYVYKDGLMACIEDMDLNVDFDEQWFHWSYQATITDTEGRETKLDGKVFGHTLLDSHPELKLHEGPGECAVDGRPGVGWLECAWPTAYLNHIRANGPYETTRR
ncbi:hypothetical protein [Novosphingobium sp. 9U]|uniref:DUF7064 domain-containing protein n=1 Tax=Novosphingobium sp. 9U TaxID=2653158 RepID=UPI0012F47475|nr:hypothetical protein [Novosphingobium sp. 9U]VWX50066.1 conserved hypothetical protein [Novosphingobium sp. 9U]